jgi:hypothetical protein
MLRNTLAVCILLATLTGLSVFLLDAYRTEGKGVSGGRGLPPRASLRQGMKDAARGVNKRGGMAVESERATALRASPRAGANEAVANESAFPDFAAANLDSPSLRDHAADAPPRETAAGRHIAAHLSAQPHAPPANGDIRAAIARRAKASAMPLIRLPASDAVSAEDPASSAGPDHAPTLVAAAPEASSDSPSPSPSPAADAESPSELSATGKVLTPELLALREKVRRCLDLYYERPESANDFSPWGIMHALISYGVDTNIVADGRTVNAAGWLCFNGRCRGLRLMSLSNDGIRVAKGPGLQGHPGQLMAILAQSRVMSDYPIKIDGKDFTVADLIEYEKKTCYSGTELTFKLIGLSHYLPSDATWKNDRGDDWDIPRLIREELAQPVVGAACGGTHRMMGFSYAVRKREKRGESIDGQWLRAQKYVDSYIDYTYSLQNDDGSFSTAWFAGRGNTGGYERRLETTGHMLEWLVYSIPSDQLDDPRTVKSVDYLAQLLLDRQRTKLEIGPKGHALHALVMYDERFFAAQRGDRRERLVKQGDQAKAASADRVEEARVESAEPAR